MALHSGTAEERDGDFFGPAVNRVARLLAYADARRNERAALRENEAVEAALA